MRLIDLISRQAAIDKFEPWLKVKGYNEGELNMLKAVLYELKFLPSAQPEQTGGRVMSGFVTRVEPEKEEPFTVIFTTDDHGKYMHIENECRKMIGHAKPTTNADHIRAMSDEELAMIICCQDHKQGDECVDASCYDCTLDWLKQEAEG